MAIGGFPTFKKASDLAGATGLGLLIFGPPGVGKTFAAAIIRHLPSVTRFS